VAQKTASPKMSSSIPLSASTIPLLYAEVNSPNTRRHHTVPTPHRHEETKLVMEGTATGSPPMMLWPSANRFLLERLGFQPGAFGVKRRSWPLG